MSEIRREPQAKIAHLIISMVAFSILAGAILFILPLLVGGIVELMGLTAKQAGLIAAADMFGATSSALGVSFIVSRGRWRFALFSGIGVLFVADVSAGLAHTFCSLFLIRIVAGLGEGTIFAITNAGIGETRSPDRVFGFCGVGQLVFASLALYITPSLLSAFGLQGVFWSLAVLTGGAAFLVRHMPDGPLRGSSTINARGRRLSADSVMGLIGLFAYFVAQGGVWAYLDRLGVSKQFETAAIGMSLAASSIAGLLGAGLSSWLAIRRGRIRPLLFSTLCTVISLYVFNNDTTFIVFAVMTSLFNFAWNLAVPYQFGALAQIDPSRRTVALGSSVAYSGVMMGPVIGGVLIGENSFHNVNWMGMVFCMSSFLLFCRILLPIENTRLSLQ